MVKTLAKCLHAVWNLHDGNCSGSGCLLGVTHGIDVCACSDRSHMHTWQVADFLAVVCASAFGSATPHHADKPRPEVDPPKTAKVWEEPCLFSQQSQRV